MPDLSSKLLDVVCQIMVGGIVGFITFALSNRIKAIPVKKEAMQHTLNKVLLPIFKETMKNSNTIEEISHQVTFIENIIKTYPFDVPQVQILKIKYINELIERYYEYSDGSKAKEIAEKRIKSEFSDYKCLLRTQRDYLRKQLGYPCDSITDYIRYKTGSPYSTWIFIIFFGAIWIIIYISFYFQGRILESLITLVIPSVIIVIIAIIQAYVKRKGGFRLMLQDIKNKKELKKACKDEHH